MSSRPDVLLCKASLLFAVSLLVSPGAQAEVPSACVALATPEDASPYRVHQLESDFYDFMFEFLEGISGYDQEGTMENVAADCEEGEGRAFVFDDLRLHDRGNLIGELDGDFFYCLSSDSLYDYHAGAFHGVLSIPGFSFEGTWEVEHKDSKSPPYWGRWTGNLSSTVAGCTWLASYDGRDSSSDAETGTTGASSYYSEQVTLNGAEIASFVESICTARRGQTTLNGTWIDTPRWDLSGDISSGIDEDRDGFAADEDPDDHDAERTPCDTGSGDHDKESACGCATSPDYRPMGFSLLLLGLGALSLGRREPDPRSKNRSLRSGARSDP